MKKTLILMMVLLIILLPLTACSNTGSGDIEDNNSKTQDAKNISGYWLHRDEILSYHIKEDDTFTAYSHGANALHGTVEWVEDKIHLKYSEESISIGAWDKEEETLSIEGVDGLFYYTAESFTPDPPDHPDGPDYVGQVLGSWYSTAYEEIFIFDEDYTYRIQGTTGNLDSGIFKAEGEGIEFQTASGNTHQAVYHAVSDGLHISGYDGIFLSIDSLNPSPPDPFVITIHPLLGSWISDDQLSMFTFYEDYTYRIDHQGGGVTTGTITVDGGTFETLSNEFGTMGRIEYDGHDDRLTISGYLGEFYRGTIEIVINEPDPIDDLFVGTWNESEKGYSLITDSTGVATLTMNGSAMEGTYTVEGGVFSLTVDGTTYEGSFDYIQNGIFIKGLGVFSSNH